HIRPTDVTVQLEEDHDTELTKLAEGSVEQGVNEVASVSHIGDDDFDGKVKKAKTVNEANKVKNDARKKKKAQRQNRKKNRK
ncbi:hypothetical protein N3930_46385, partial [Bacillus thuringiensis]|nr:hypothetical protein [Bacillus thuringiensis]